MIPVPDRIFAVSSGPLGSVRAANRPTYWKEYGYPQDYDPEEFVRSSVLAERDAEITRLRVALRLVFGYAKDAVDDETYAMATQMLCDPHSTGATSGAKNGPEKLGTTPDDTTALGQEQGRG